MTGPLAQYRALLARGELKDDEAQARIALMLDNLAHALGEAERPGLISRLRSALGMGMPAPRGLYIHGGVGRGKSMLMDLFFDTVPIARKRRVHFHEFMLEVHATLARLRSDRSVIDPLPRIAHEIGSRVRLLCFDEFHVTDVADAMILGRLFDALIKAGMTVVATSNRAPDDLYQNGLNRQLFLPFIARLKSSLDIAPLDGPTDYRMMRMKGMRTWLTPVDAASTAELRRIFLRLTDRDVEDPAETPSATLDLDGRTLFVPKAMKGVAVFSFKRLCAGPVGAADYLAIAHRYHSVILVAVPKMGPERRNEAKRFVTLVDIFYENGVKLIASAEAEPEALYPDGDGSFEFARTVSRLNEMQSEAYHARGHCAAN
ncbi:MAG: cell division protein ZapE [Rhodothalassiaceae bacterium]